MTLNNLFFSRLIVPVAVSTLLYLSGCAISDRTREYGSPTPKFTYQRTLEKNLYVTPPRRCLALSGGGIRSASVSIGVLSEMLRLDKLTEFDLMASVSGGGWAVYWLYSSLFDLAFSEESVQGAGKRKIADNLDSVGDKNFLNKSEFWATVMGSLASLPINVGGSAVGVQSFLAHSYESAIRHKFGSSNVSKLKVRNLLPVVEAFHLPTPIFLMSAKPGSFPPFSKYEFDGSQVVEVSPLWMGSRRLEAGGEPVGFYVPTRSSDGSGDLNVLRKNVDRLLDLELSNAVAISAAAIDAPQFDSSQEAVPDLAKFLGVSLGGVYPLGPSQSKVFLSDAGFVDNLGVVSLLDHGCKEILSIDASHDPDLDFASMEQMISVAQSQGWTVGEKVWGNKQSLSETVQNSSGYELPHHRIEVRLTNRDGGNVNLHIMKLGILKDYEDRYYPEEVSGFLKENWATVGSEREPCQGKGLNTSCRFPHQSTVQQSFSPREFNAYVSLGRLIARLSGTVQTER